MEPRSPETAVAQGAAASTLRVLYSIAFTWPRGAHWSHAQRSGRNGPGWYADRVTDLVARRAVGGMASFAVHVHGAIDPRARDALLSRWRDAFTRARGPASGGDARLELVVCDEALPSMWPAAMRVAPLVDDTSERVVICIDVHDDARRQTMAIDALLQQMHRNQHSVGLTAWAGYDLRSSFPRDDPTIAPVQVLRIIEHRGTEEGVVWHLDCGLLISLRDFRRELRELGVPTYEAHLAYCNRAFEYDSGRTR